MTLKSDGQIYDFCMDWQMNVVSKKLLCQQFVEQNWDFSQFREVALKYNWFVNSMYALLYAEDFASK